MSELRHISEYMAPLLLSPDSDVATPYGGNLRTGLGDLDSLLGGINPSDLIVVAARTSVGKTALMLNFARNAAVTQNAKVAVFSLEMAGEQLAQRLLAGDSLIDSARLRLGMLSEIEESRMMDARGRLSEADIYFDDSAATLASEISEKSKRLQEENGLDLVIVDYVQLIHDYDAGPDGDGASHISRGFKQLARELDVPVILGSQLASTAKPNPYFGASLEDLPGPIADEADIVLLINRESMYMTRADWDATHPDLQREPYPEEKAVIMVAKHRNGPTGAIDVRFRAQFSRFEDWYQHAGEPRR